MFDLKVELGIEIKIWVSSSVTQIPRNTFRVVHADLWTGSVESVQDYPDEKMGIGRAAALAHADGHNAFLSPHGTRVYRVYDSEGQCIRNEDSVCVLEATN